MNDELLKLQMLEHLEETENLGSLVTFYSHEGKYYVYRFHLYPEKVEMESELLEKYNAMDRLQCEKFGMRFKNQVKIHLTEGRTILDVLADLGIENFKVKSQNSSTWS